MALFVVRHQHTADACPARDPLVGASLLNYLSRPNVRKYGVQIQGEAVVQGEHTAYFIVEADDEAGLRAFMKPFEMAGSLDVYPASTCVRVVASGGCAAPTLEPGGVSSLDPEEACQQAIDAGLVVHRAHPLNCETSIRALIGGVVMPNARFYVRNHFAIPSLDAATFQLTVGGHVDRPLSLSARDLQNMRSQTLVVTLECAGNGRTLFDRPTEGEKWAVGAVSTAEWTGVPLMEVLDRAGVRSGAREVLFRGADCGTVDGRSESIHFERSLRLDDARVGDVLLAYAMNGEPLPIQHGYPLRLLVPRWYAVASVKWLTEIEVIDRPFHGYYQGDKYMYEWRRSDQLVREPVTLQRVRALITDPAADTEVRSGELAIRGVAWSGAAPIARVEVSVGGGPWQETHLVGERNRHNWQWWELVTRVEKSSGLVLRARATDLADRAQPERAEWNRLGYGNNAIQEYPFACRNAIMRVAVLNDVHANLPALEAVLEEVRDARVELIVFGGDVVPGPMVRETLSCVLYLDIPAQFIHGNGELAVLAQIDAPDPSAVTYWGTTGGAPLPEPFREVIRWTARHVQPDYTRVLASWPKTFRLDVPGLGGVLFCHGTPASETDAFTRLTPEDVLVPVFDGLGVRLVVCGHTHMQFDRMIGATRVVNAGSVGMPFGRTGADWLLLGPDVELRNTSYDPGSAAERIRATGYPEAESLAIMLREPLSEADILEQFTRISF